MALPGELEAMPPASAEDADAKLSDVLARTATAMALSLTCAPPSVERPSVGEDWTSSAAMLAKIRGALDELLSAERYLVERHYFGEVSIEQAAREIGLSKMWGRRIHVFAIDNLTRAFSRGGSRRRRAHRRSVSVLGAGEQ